MSAALTDVKGHCIKASYLFSSNRSEMKEAIGCYLISQVTSELVADEIALNDFEILIRAAKRKSKALQAAINMTKTAREAEEAVIAALEDMRLDPCSASDITDAINHLLWDREGSVKEILHRVKAAYRGQEDEHLQFNWDQISEEKFEELMSGATDTLASVFVGDIAVEFLRENEDELGFNLYVANEDTGYGVTDGDIPYDYAEGGTVYLYTVSNLDDFKREAEGSIEDYICAHDASPAGYSLAEHAERPTVIW